MFVKLVNFLPASIKSINQHITESFACTQKILAFMFLLPTNGTFRNMFKTKTIKINNFISVTKQQSSVCLHPHIHQDLLRVPHPLYF